MNTQELEHRFSQIYGKRAQHTYSALGRVNLIGKHTDYIGGLVSPYALSFGTYLLIAKREDQIKHERVSKAIDVLKGCNLKTFEQTGKIYQEKNNPKVIFYIADISEKAGKLN